eukprot:5966062-Amphidinium_carterae.1
MRSVPTRLSKLEILVSGAEKLWKPLSTPLPALEQSRESHWNKAVSLACRWTDGSGRHSSNPHFRRCGVGYVTDTGERARLPLPGCWQSVFRAELQAVVRALEEYNPRRVVNDCKGVVKALQAIQSGGQAKDSPRGGTKTLK